MTLRHRTILEMRVDATSYSDAAGRVLTWARRRESRYVCVATVHMVMEGHDSIEFRQIVNGADLVTPDGMPLVWGLRRLGLKDVTRVYGPDLTCAILDGAAREGIGVGFYGGSARMLAQLLRTVSQRFPALDVRFAKSPPFRPLSTDEDERDVRDMNRSGTCILFVGLGCPKQERWMAEHAGRVRAVMLGVGAAFDFLAGVKPQAPDWMQASGLEWLFRLATEPRRLWHRYLVLGPRFVALFSRQLLNRREGRPRYHYSDPKGPASGEGVS